MAVGGGLFSSSSIEQFLLGTSEGQLAWGPALFRALLVFHGVALLALGWIGREADVGLAFEAKSKTNNVDPSCGRSVMLALLGLLIIGTALRLYRLDTCLWFDEVMTVVELLRLPLSEVVATFSSQNQHMLFSVMGSLSFTVFGESAAAARVPAVMFGVAGIAAMFLLGRKVVGTRESLLATGLMTFSYHHIWFSQNARGYSGLLFFSMLSTWLFLEALERGGRRWWVWYGVSMSLGLWVHMTMAFVIAAQVFVYAIMVLGGIFNRETRSSNEIDSGFAIKGIVTYVLAATATLQLYAVSLPEFFRSALHEESRDSEWTNLMWVVKETVRRLADTGVMGVGLMVCVLVMLVGWLSMTRRDWRAGLLMVLPALLGGGSMIALQHNLWPRFFFFCMGFLLLVAIRGGFIVVDGLVRVCVRSSNREVWSLRLATVAAMMVIAGSAYTIPRCYALPKQDYIGAKDYVEQTRVADEEVVAVGLAGKAYRIYFAPEWSWPRTVEELRLLMSKHDRLRLVYTLDPQLKAFVPEIWDVIKDEFEIEKTFYGTLGGGEINVCRRRLAGSMKVTQGQ